MAFHLNYDPDISRMPVDKAAEVFNISDLRPALADFLLRWAATPNHSGARTLIGGCRLARDDAYLPCSHLRVWYSFKIQQRSRDREGEVPPSQKVLALPAKLDEYPEWPVGWFDPVILGDSEQLCCSDHPTVPAGPGLRGEYQMTTADFETENELDRLVCSPSSINLPTTVASSYAQPSIVLCLCPTLQYCAAKHSYAKHALRP